IQATAGARGTTITDAALLQKCEDAVKRSRFTTSETAPETQKGTLTFVFKVN
ncbi:MAG: hypothetical protein JWQ85_3724, partial [Mucilaginibacter sp.]|nr:hypothetical protein [Mucilaginibacter sp.]